MHPCAAWNTAKQLHLLLFLPLLLVLLMTACQGGREVPREGMEDKPVVVPGNGLSDNDHPDGMPAGVPAYPDTITYVLPDGYELYILLRGDEWGHVALTADGYYLLMNDGGFYEYASPGEDQALVSTGVVARNEADRSDEEQVLLQQLKTFPLD